MKMLDLFAGLEGWSEPWREAGHEVFSVDWDTSFDVDLHADILDLHPCDLPWKPDIILASPPCETFSQLSVRWHWTRDHLPKTEKAVLHYKLLDKTLDLVDQLAPQAWLIENPVAKMRSMPLMQAVPRSTVWYCQYGMPYAKPTDLFGYVPTWVPRAQCHNQKASHPYDCMCRNHVAAPRGSKTGVQGTQVFEGYAIPPSAYRNGPGHANISKMFGSGPRAALRAKVPYDLSKEVMDALHYAERTGQD